ncbi:MAG: hypothetical protein J5765_00445 [Clostridia bacterium]|nr:hypothetical protein [Clostridia bacterium]
MIGFGYLFLTQGATGGLHYLLFFLFYLALYGTLLNAVLIAFNLLPIYPLDGFRVVESLSRTDNAYVRFMRRYGQYILIGIVVIGFFFERIGFPQGDVFGQYLSAVQQGILDLFYLIMEGVIG